MRIVTTDTVPGFHIQMALLETRVVNIMASRTQIENIAAGKLTMRVMTGGAIIILHRGVSVIQFNSIVNFGVATET